MPQPRHYRTRAEQQAAYRRRQLVAQKNQLAARRLPPLPALPTVPGRHRWQALLELAQWAVQSMVDERDEYFDARSETWQDSDRGERFKDITNEIEAIVSTLETLDLDPV